MSGNARPLLRLSAVSAPASLYPGTHGQINGAMLQSIHGCTPTGNTPAMLQIHTSNRLDTLLERLAQHLERPLPDPFTPERVVVQNPGMGRWITQRLAERNGVVANIDFPLPGRFIWSLLGYWFDELPPESDWSRERLTWRLFELLATLSTDPAFEEPRRYLDGEPGELKRYQLARRIADVFDQYLVYRPQLVLKWEAGHEDHWQAQLWRALREQGYGPHRARLFDSLSKALHAGQAPHRSLPERILLFGLSALPPVDCELLGQVAQRTDIQLFVLNPCREYWADIVDERSHTRRRARALRAGLPDPSSLLDLGNPLLASWGHASQSFLDQLLELGDLQDHFDEPDESRLLGRLQADILALRDRRDRPLAEREVLDAEDISMQLHACHSPLREVQVLHDRLLHLFETLLDLAPRDILVMAPEIERYAPAIEAVFGGAPNKLSIPWSIADRRPAHEHPMLALLATLLELPDSRLSAVEVLGWLEVSALRRRFGIEEEALERIRLWVNESGIRWGVDGAMRAELELPEEDAHSWNFGLQRLFLGYALTPDEGLYEDTLPSADIEGQTAVALGGLQDLLDTLATWRKELRRARPLAEWATTINTFIDACFAPSAEEEAALYPLRLVLDRLRHDAETLRFTTPLDHALMRSEVLEALALAPPAQHFLTGRVTFCNMVPMRSIPARVICLIGMNGIDFPRDQRPAAFDLIARGPRRGDRSRRQDDRNLFLEALLSARELLYLSWVGFDNRDNTPRVPTVMISELLDYLDRSERTAEGTRLSTWLRLDHPLQPFSTRYFTPQDARLFSYRAEWCDAAQPQTSHAPGASLSGPLPPVEPPANMLIELADLIECLRFPAQWFLRRRLGIRSALTPELLDEHEPFWLDSLERWQLRQSLWQYAPDPKDPDRQRKLLRGAAALPHGVVGDLALARERDRTERLRRAVQETENTLNTPHKPLEIDLDGGTWRLQGWIDGVYTGGLWRYRLGKLRAQDRLQLWIEHLVLNALSPEAVEPCSQFLAEDVCLSLKPLDSCEQALKHLKDLLALYEESHHRPLHFFPDTSFAELREEPKKKKERETCWFGDPPYRRGESMHEAVRILFRDTDPLDAAFADLAHRIYAPLIEHSSERKADHV